MSALDKLFGGILSAVSPTYEANRPQEESEKLYKSLIGNQVEDFGGVTEAIKEQKELDEEVKQQVKELEEQNNREFKDPEKKTGLASLNKKSDNVISSQEKIDASSNVTEQQQDIEVDTAPTISQMYPRGTNLIKLYESQNKSGNPYLKAYKDPSTGKFTIGFGNIMIDGRPVKEGDVITEAKAIQMFNESLRESIDELNDLKSFLPKGVKFSKGFETALISILHNSSPDKIKYTPKKRNETRAFKALKKGDLQAFSKELFDPKVGLVSAGGKIRKGLVNRRQQELKFLDPLERYDIQIKQSGGMIESDPYKRQPRFI
jgi:GH24 family phage-related lysozyme (muramidase)